MTNSVSKPLISIIVPCYNMEKYLPRCVESILNQTLDRELMEIILVDDCSTDSTPNLICTYEKEYPCIKSIFYEKNLRQGGARNRGIRMAQGKYLGFVDSDDWIEPTMYETMCQAAESYNCDVVNIRSVRDKEYRLLKEDEISTGLQDRLLTVTSPQIRKDSIASGVARIGAWNCIFSSALIKENHIYFPEHIIYEDLFWGSLVQLYAQKICMLEKRLYHYFVRPGSTVLTENSNTHEDFFQMQELLFKELKERQVFDLYTDALEFNFLINYYILGLKILSLRYEIFPQDKFYKMQDFIYTHFPQWESNFYIQKNTDDFQKLQFAFLKTKPSQEELHTFSQILKQYYQT